MAIPEFNEYGVLPPGTHDATRAEVVERYCDNPNRREIWDLFLEFCSVELAPMNWPRTILVDGGFTSNKAVTKDIDVILDVTTLSEPEVMQAFFWTSTNYHRFKADYKTDFWLYHPAMPDDLRAFFCYIKEQERLARGAPPGATKGLLRLEL